ncbi:MAG: TIGR02281 family clan AA aspartic protease [Burkholderiales bacterium]|nr:TIGR02281 family clan AA aspartic protease [Burkholderiales bacterium]
MSRTRLRKVALLLALAGASALAGAVPVLVATLGSSKASIAFDGKQEIVSVGDTAHGFKLVSVGSDSVVVETNGQRKTISMGQGVYGGAGSDSGSSKITLHSMGGHFFVEVGNDTASMTGLIDTGATTLALSYSQAIRLGVKIDKFTPTVTVGTAQGMIRAWRVAVPMVKVGGIVLYNVDATVNPGNFPAEPLVGMTVLSRFSMQRNGDYMTLTKRF